MGCDELLEYALSPHHAGWIGVSIGVASSLFLWIYALMALITCVWRTPLLNRRQTKILVGPYRRMMVILFTLSLPVMDFAVIHSWRLFPSRSGCPPPPDYLLTWTLVNALNLCTMGVAWFYVPYAQVMLYLPSVLYTFMAALYILMGVARTQICGTTFVVLLPLMLGAVAVYYIPIGMRVSKERLCKRVVAVNKVRSSMEHELYSLDDDDVESCGTDEELMRQHDE